MAFLRNRRIRLVAAVVLLIAVGAAGYQISVSIWTSHKYNAACDALDRFDYRQADQHLEGYLAFHPNDPAALMLAAQAARRRGNFDEAGRKLGLAEKKGASANAVAMEKQLLRVQEGHLADVGSLKEFCSDNPDGPEAALVLEAIIEGSLKVFNLPLAKWGVDFWLQHRPGAFDQAQGLIWQGRLSESILDFPEALTAYQQAVKLAPNRLEAKVRLVAALIHEEPRQAIPHLEWLHQHHPDDAEVRFQTARLHCFLGQPEEAAKLLDAILVATPNKVPVILERGRVAMDLNQLQDAERWMRRALALSPDERDVNLAVADCLRQSGKFEEAKRYRDKAQEIGWRREVVSRTRP